MAQRRPKHLRLVLPTPTQQEIETALTAMRNGTSIFGRYVGSSEYYPEYCDDKKAMWWVKIIDPAGVDQECDGGGTTSAEAAAVAWINATVGAWWVDGPSLGAEDYAKVPRRVPDGWRFELDEAPL